MSVEAKNLLQDFFKTYFKNIFFHHSFFGEKKKTEYLRFQNNDQKTNFVSQQMLNEMNMNGTHWFPLHNCVIYYLIPKLFSFSH